MSDLELLVALASTPLGVAIALPFLMLAVSGVYHMWVHRVPARNIRRMRNRIHVRRSV
jgi:hypothetical protein